MILRSDPKPAHVQRTTPQRESHGGKGMGGGQTAPLFSTTYSMLKVACPKVLSQQRCVRTQFFPSRMSLSFSTRKRQLAGDDQELFGPHAACGGAGPLRWRTSSAR